MNNPTYGVVGGWTAGPCCQSADVYHYGNLVFIMGIAKFSSLSTNTYYNFLTGLPSSLRGVHTTVGNEYGSAGNAVISQSGTTCTAKCSVADNFYYFGLVYCTNIY